MLPPAEDQASEIDEKSQGDKSGQSATRGARPEVRPGLPDVAVGERLLGQTLLDAHLTIAQEAFPKARHGRYEVRTLWTLSSADLNAYAGSAGTVGKPWPRLAQVSRIQRVVCERDRTTGRWGLSEDVAYSITSMPAERAAARDILKRWRLHWGIEALHWTRDVVFGEDGSQIYKGQAPEVFSVLRNAAVTLVGLGGFPSIAAGVRELQTRPLGALPLFARLASRMQVGKGSGQLAATKTPPKRLTYSNARAPA
ncbi:MAG: ISAs1 family transposase [Chloroflexi bacterium]|nr:ISAs1 family transposase [Chloroflexota bacterium]